MFPRFRQQALARIDLLVELMTLGEYGVDEHGGVMALDPEPAAGRPVPRTRDRCGDAPIPLRCAMACDRGAAARS